MARNFRSLFGLNGPAGFGRGLGFGMLPEPLFARQLAVEQNRALRSGRRFGLVLLNPLCCPGSCNGAYGLERTISAIRSGTRATDIQGWYAPSIIGIIFTEFGTASGKDVAQALLKKVATILRGALDAELDEASVSLHLYPEGWNAEKLVDPPMAHPFEALMQGMEKSRSHFVLRSSLDLSAGPPAGFGDMSMEAGQE